MKKKKLPKYAQGHIINDNMGQIKYPGKITRIDSPNITMRGVDFPVLGISNTGHKQMMLPEQDYTFNGSSVTEFPMAGSGIHIKKSHKGLLHKNLGVPEGKKIPASKLAIKSTDSPAVKKRKQFAINAKGWNKGQYGTPPLGSANPPIDGTQIDLSNSYQSTGVFDMYGGNQAQQYLPQQQSQGFGAQAFNKVGGWGGIAQGAGNLASGAAMGDQQIQGGPSTAQNVVGQFGPWGKAISTVSQFATRTLNKSDNEVLGGITNAIFDPGSAWTNKDLSTKDRIIGGINPIYGGIKAAQARKIRKEQSKKLKNLMTKAEKSGNNEDSRQYIRPEDQLVDPNTLTSTYGTGTNYLKNGGKLALGGELQTHWGGYAKPMSYNPYIPGGESVEFIGNSHQESDGKGRTGIGVTFGKNKVEVEQGEPAMKLQNGGERESLTVFGDMKIPSYGVSELGDSKAKGKKFKSYIKELNKEEVKNTKTIDKHLISASETEPLTPFDKLKIDTNKAMITGADMNLKNIAGKKQVASSIQNAILDTASEFGLQSSELAKGKFVKAKNGKTLPSYQQGGKGAIGPQYSNIDPRTTPQMQKYNTEHNLFQALRYKNQLTGVNNNLIPSSYNLITGQPSITQQVGGGMQAYTELSPETLIKMDSVIDASRKALFPNQVAKPYKDGGNIAQNGKRVKPRMAGDASQYYVENRAELDSDNVITQPTDNTQATKSPAWIDAGMNIFNQVLPYIRPTNNVPLGAEQLAGERYALMTNQLEGVQAQKYTPLLEQVTDISLQDQMNANQADFNNLLRANSANPAVQATLAAQKYAANSNVLGEQFRLNQSNKIGTYNKNREILNDATIKNLAILDQQYQRQTQAKANTKAIAKSALESIGNKIAQNKLENRILDIDQQRYNYRFGPNGVPINMNPLQQFYIPQVGDDLTQLDENGDVTQMQEQIERRDSKGRVTGTQNKQRVTKKSSNGSILKGLKSY